ncbi:MAG TPA: hypothetical protein VGH20_21320 [Myxococcales bacterium]
MNALLAHERTSRVTPFGVRFVDDQSGRVVADSLTVTAWPSAEPSRAVPLFRNAGNAFCLFDAPGLREESFGEGDAAYFASLARRIDFTFEVSDLAARFLPFRASVTLPSRGLYRLGCGSPPSPVALPAGSEADGVPLFSGPARPATANSVVLRAELWDATLGKPAAWAMLEAQTPGAALRGEPKVRALADHRGCVALHFPLPDEQDFDGGSFDSPSGSSGAPLGARTWTVNVSARYGRIAQAPDTVRRIDPPIPDLCAAISQPQASLWNQLNALPLGTVSMRFGQETSLASVDPGAAPPSVVLVTAP